MLAKQPVDISFAKGVDTKTDPWRVPVGNFLALENMVFTTGSRLTKRAGYGALKALPEIATFLSTFNGNLTAIGTSLQALSSSTNTWVNKGTLHPVELSVLPLIRSNTNQSQLDTAVASNGLVCTVYTDQTPTSLSTPRYMYAIANSITGQNVISPTVIPVSSGAVTGSPRVFVLGAYFVIVFTNVISGTSHLQYIAVSVSDPTIVRANADIASSYISSTRLSWDGVVVGNKLFVAYNTTSGGQSIKITSLTSTFILTTPVTYSNASKVTATIMSMTADVSNPVSPVIWASYYDVATTTGFTVAVDQNLNKIISVPAATIASGTILNLATVASNGVMTLYYEVSNNYSYDSGIPTHYVSKVTCTQAGVVGTPAVLVRSVGLASKGFIADGDYYFFASYQSTFQPTYFLINSTGQVVSRFAYSNGGGYCNVGLPSVTVTGNLAQVGYLFKDFITSQNTSTIDSVSKSNIYAQKGLNLISFVIGTSNVSPAEIAQSLHISGGFLWDYDGYLPVENNFFLWPDDVEATTSTTGGSLDDQLYQYQVVYTWTDNQGNIQYSAPSIPVSVTTTGGDTSTNTINIPTLRLTYKISNPVKIEIFRWSVAQQEFFQITSIATPLINNVAVDSVAYVDTQADSAILGNSLMYTTGNVIENIGPPGFNDLTLWDDRLWGIASEDPNLLWYSKQVIEATHVDMRDLFTLYVAPSIGSQGSTGVMKCISPMDDKLIVFKANALYYINGTGPDNLGANSQYSEPLFITSVVGSSNQQSIVFMPDGLMFQSDKGIWLLSRQMAVSFIGAAVESYTQNATVQSALCIPGTTQVRFTLSSGITLMYDYFYGQWGTFSGVPAISSTLYQDMHTYLSSEGSVFQEQANTYVDGSNPVLMKFKTSWISLAGLQGYQRAYFFYLLGRYITPHFLNLSIAYDYNDSPEQTSLITPDNYAGTYGSVSPYGQQNPYGGPGDKEQWRIFLTKQRCQAFQITLEEIYDDSLGVAPGAGLTISGLNLLIGVARSFRAIGARNSIGGGTNPGGGN